MSQLMVNQPVVIDNGSGVIKAGFAGDPTPKCIFYNLVGRPKHLRVMAGALEGENFIGRRAEEHRGLLTIKHPMEHGIVTDWNEMEKIWHHIYSKDLLATFSEEHPVLLTEAPLNPRKNREKTAEIFFETLNVPALYVSLQAVLSLYASGRLTGIVLDSGDGVSQAVPIYQGFALPLAISRSDIAGRDVSRYLKFLLRKDGLIFNTTAEFEIVREIKEKICYLSTSAAQRPFDDRSTTAPGTGSELENHSFVLPDGKTVEIGAFPRTRGPEILFRPDLIGHEFEGVHQVLNASIQKADMDLRQTFYSNIVLSGGSTMIRGFGDRLLNEMKLAAPKEVKIRISAPQERIYSTWIGGSIFASLEAFKRMWISKKEYDEEGVRIVHKKTI